MKRTLNLLVFVLLLAASVLGVFIYTDTENDGELVKALRDPDRVDKRWLYVTGLATAGVCLALQVTFEKESKKSRKPSVNSSMPGIDSATRGNVHWREAINLGKEQ